VSPLQDDKLLYTVPHAAEVLDLSKTTIWNMIRDGQLESIKVRNRRMVTRTAIESYLAALASGGAS
jgi:excisionase family DNA binding protein